MTASIGLARWLAVRALGEIQKWIERSGNGKQEGTEGKESHKATAVLRKDTLTTQVNSRKIEQYAETRKAEEARCTTINKELAAVRHAMKKRRSGATSC